MSRAMTDHREKLDDDDRDTDELDPGDLPSTIPLVVRRAAARFGDRDALVDGDDHWSFSSLADAVDTAARAFVASGLVVGDRVAIWAPNVAQWAIAALGVYTAGCVVVPLNTRFKGTEAGHVLRASGARMLLTVTDFLDTDYLALLDGVDGLDALEHTVVLRGRVPPGSTSWADLLAGAGAVTPEEVEARVAALDREDTSDILFTSGTTGAPKGAMLSYRNLIVTSRLASEREGLRADDEALAYLPMAWVGDNVLSYAQAILEATDQAAERDPFPEPEDCLKDVYYEGK